MFNATRARELADQAQSLDGEFGKKATEMVLARLEDQAKKGHNSWCGGFDSAYAGIIRKRLEQLGFVVVYHPGDQREPSFYSVTW